MLQSLPISLDAPAVAALAVSFCALACVIALLRQLRLPRLAAILLATGLIALCLAAGGARWRSSLSPRVVVMVDVSSSTRTATYHDSDTLANRLDQLLGSTPYTMFAFAEGSWRTDLSQLPTEVPGRRTALELPPADAIVLFSDGRFEPPATSPPIFAVIDSALEHADDGAITRLDANDRALSIDLSSSDGAARDVVLSGAAPQTLSAPPGRTVLAATIEPGATHATARIVEQDRWPENNSMTIAVPPPTSAQRWWITRDSSSAPSQGWRVMVPGQLPPESTSYLGVAVMTLDNISADEIARLQHERIEQYVRDLGGGLVILGGDRAFAAGGYAGTALERLSPLSCNPPQPATHWVLLIDSSGSMATTIGDNSRWNFAANAMLGLIQLLPPKDTISIGDFAWNVRWWTIGTPVEQTNLSDLMPREVTPTGPTNLAPALRQLAQDTDRNSPTQAIVISDAETTIDDAATLARDLVSKRVRVSILSPQPLARSSALYDIVQRTQGVDLAQSDPREWAATLKMLLRSASPPSLGTSPLEVSFTLTAPPLPRQSASLWNRTWRKLNATELATGRDAAGNDVPAVAAWNMRSGAVLSAAFRPSAQVIEELAEIVAIPPRDPRFSVTWETAPQLRVTLDALDGEHPMNDLHPQLVLNSEQTFLTFSQPLTQVAPGKYSVTLPPPRRAVLASLMLDSKALDRVAVAERYPAEFNAIGNDRAVLRRVAQQSGGEVIEPNRNSRIELPRRHQTDKPISSPLAAVGAALLAAGVGRWKIG